MTEHEVNFVCTIRYLESSLPVPEDGRTQGKEEGQEDLYLYPGLPHTM
jgi:hypothetical protein